MASSKKVQLLDKWASKLFPFNYNLGQPTSPSLKYFLYYKLESENALILKYLHDNIKKTFIKLFLVNLRLPIFISLTKKQFIVIPAHRYL